MLRRLISASAVHFWRPEIFKNVANPDFENIKYLQNLGHFLLNASYITGIEIHAYQVRNKNEANRNIRINVREKR